MSDVTRHLSRTSVMCQMFVGMRHKSTVKKGPDTEQPTASYLGIMYLLKGVMFHMQSVNCQLSSVNWQI